MRSASKERQQARAERMNINQSMRINRISLFTNFYSKCIYFFRPSEHRTLENAQSNEISNVLEQYFREFDIRNVTVEDPEPETLLDQIATLLELHFHTSGATLLARPSRKPCFLYESRFDRCSKSFYYIYYK